MLHLIKAPHYLDTKLTGSVSGASTDFLVAVGIASIVPAVVATYIVPLIILCVVGWPSAWCCSSTSHHESSNMVGSSAVFSWGWATETTRSSTAKILPPPTMTSDAISTTRTRQAQLPPEPPPTRGRLAAVRGGPLFIQPPLTSRSDTRVPVW